MLECKISDLKINEELAQWTVKVTTDIGTGSVKLGSSAIEKKDLIDFYQKNGITLPEEKKSTECRVLLSNECFVGLVDKNDCVITPNEINTKVR